MRRNSAKSKIFRGMGWGLVIIVLLVSMGWVYRSHFLTGSLQVTLAKEGSIKHYQNVTAVFANEETVLKANLSGTPNFLFQEGQRVRKGDTVANVQEVGALGQGSGREDRVVAPVGGLLYTFVDGLEGILTPDNLLAMDVHKVIEQTSNFKEDTQGGSANSRIIGKIVNNLVQTSAVINMSTAEYQEGNTLRLIIDDQTYSAKILRLLDNPQGVVVQFNQYINGSSEERIQEIALIAKPTVSGILIPKSSLWYRGEEQGVYVVREGSIQYRKVKILDEDEEYICVENLPHGIPVIVNPRDGLAGLLMNIN